MMRIAVIPVLVLIALGALAAHAAEPDSAPLNDVLRAAGAPSFGDPAAPATLVEFSRFGCFRCRMMQPVVADLRERYGERLRVIYVPDSRTGGPAVERATAAALAAGRQGQYLAMAELLHDSKGRFDNLQIEAFAKRLELDLERFNRDRASDEIRRTLERFNELATDHAVDLLPTFFINGHRTAGRREPHQMVGLVERHGGLGDTPQTAAPQVAGSREGLDFDIPTWDELIYPVENLEPVTARTKLQPGDRAPDFTLPRLGGGEVNLHDALEEHVVVLSFVPSAWTPVCTGQWPHYAEMMPRFEAAGARILGITTDNLPTLYAWTKGMGELHFDVLSDFWPHGEAGAAYGILRPESGVAERALFVIDRDRIIRFVEVHDINSEPSAEQLLDAVRAATTPLEDR